MKNVTRYLILAVLVAISFNAQAAMWMLVHSEYVGGTWMCTYQLQGGNYQMTVSTNTYCASFVNQ